MRYIFIIACFMVLSGCATVGKPIKENSVNEIQKGVTTKQEIITRFGQPGATYFDASDRLIFTYYASKVSNSAWNFIPVINLVHSEMKQKTQHLTIVFEKDIVQEYSFTNSDNPIKYGILP